MSNFDIERVLERLKRFGGKRKFDRSIDKKYKNSDINSMQKKFRPDFAIKIRKRFGTNKKRSYFDMSDDFNEYDC